MSWRATSWAAEQVTGSPISKLVLLKLADNANDEGVAWPSLETIAAHTELGRRTVQDHLARLDRLGLISVEVRTAESGASLSNKYRLNMARQEGAAPAPQGAAGAGEDAARRTPRVQLPAPPKEPSLEPSGNRHSHAPAGASEGVASLGQEDLSLWPAFRTAIADTWPDGFPTDNEPACKAEFGKLTRTVRGEQLVEIARLHGAALAKRQAQRSKSAGKMLVKAPSNFLRSGEWQGYVGAADEARAAESNMAGAIGRVRRGLGDQLFDILRNGVGLADGSLALLDGSTFEPGPPPIITVPGSAARVLLDRHLFTMQRHLGDGLLIMPVPHVRRA